MTIETLIRALHTGAAVLTVAILVLYARALAEVLGERERRTDLVLHILGVLLYWLGGLFFYLPVVWKYWLLGLPGVRSAELGWRFLGLVCVLTGGAIHVSARVEPRRGFLAFLVWSAAIGAVVLLVLALDVVAAAAGA